MRLPLCSRWRWRAVIALWAAALVVGVASPALGLPLRVEGVDISLSSALVVLGLAVAWGDMRRAVKEITNRLDRLPCQGGECQPTQHHPKRSSERRS